MLTTLNIISLDQGKGLVRREDYRGEPVDFETTAEAAKATARGERRRLLAGLAALIAAWPVTTRRRRAIS